HRAPRAPHSSPTRRSSDLAAIVEDGQLAGVGNRRGAEEAGLDGFPRAVAVAGQQRDALPVDRVEATAGVERRSGAIIEDHGAEEDRKSTRLNSSHVKISYA